MKAGVILLAAGKSSRFKTKNKKQFIKLKGKHLFEYSLQTFLQLKFITQIILVVPEKDINKIKTITKKYKKVTIVPGGEERYNSVSNGIKVLNNNIDYIIIHDAARPLVDKETILRCMNTISTYNYDCVIPGIKVSDTIKTINNNNEVIETINREKIVAVQTPQVMKKHVGEKVYSDEILNKWTQKYKITDDAQLVELEGYKVKVVPGSIRNIKITTIDDLEFIQFFLSK